MSVIIRPRSWGQVKPPLGTPLVSGHPLATGLVGGWLVNEEGGPTIYDAVGTTNLTVISTATREAGGLRCDATGEGADGVLVGNDLRINAPMSFAVRIARLGAATQVPLFGVLQNNTDSYPWYCYAVSVDFSGNFELIWNEVGFANANSTTVPYTNFPVGETHLLTCVITSSERRIYLDGQVLYSGATGGTASTVNYTSTSRVYFGYRAGAATANPNTRYHEAYIWKRVLSSTEVAELAREPYTMFALRRYWSLGGALTPVELSVSSSGTASFLRSASLVRSGSGTVTVSQIRSAALIRSSGATSTASAVKSAGLIRSASATGTATVSALRRLISQLSASATGTAAFVRSVLRSTNAAATGTVAQVRQVALTRSSVATTTATFIRTAYRNMSASATGTAAATATKVLMRLLEAAATATTSAVRSVARNMSQTVTGTPAASKAISLARFAASAATASTIRRIDLIRSAASSITAALQTALGTLSVTLSAGATATAAFVRQVTKQFAPSATATATAVKGVSLVRSAVSNGAAALTRMLPRVLSTGVTGTAVMSTVKVLMVALAAACTAAASFVRRIAIVRTAGSTGIASRIAEIIGGGVGVDYIAARLHTVATRLRLDSVAGFLRSHRVRDRNREN